MAEVIKPWDNCRQVALPLAGAKKADGVKRGALVSCGQLLARSPGLLCGDVHAPVDGEIVELSEMEILIRREPEAVGRSPRPVDLTGLTAVELAEAFKELGLDVPEVYPGEPFIIAAFNPEPGLSWASALFSEHRETMLAGLDALAALYPGHPQVWAATRAGSAPEGLEEVIVNSAYPHTHPRLVKKAVLGRPTVSVGGVFDGRDLFFLGRVWRTGLPLTTMPLSLGKANYLVPIGSKADELLSFANLTPKAGDLVVAGGLVSGRALIRLAGGLGKKDGALHLVKHKRLNQRPAPCRGCGECQRACPLKLPVPRAGRLEPSAWAKGEGADFITGCIKCGVCALACPSRRPLLSMARLLKP